MIFFLSSLLSLNEISYLAIRDTMNESCLNISTPEGRRKKWWQRYKDWKNIDGYIIRSTLRFRTANVTNDPSRLCYIRVARVVVECLRLFEKECTIQRTKRGGIELVPLKYAYRYRFSYRCRKRGISDVCVSIANTSLLPQGRDKQERKMNDSRETLKNWRIRLIFPRLETF